MSRTEKTEGALPAQTAPAPAPVVADSIKRRGGCGCLAACLVVPLVFLATAAAAAAWLVAAMGLAHLPVFTALAYKRPEPVREVRVSDKDAALLSPKTLEAFSVSANADGSASLPEGIDEKTLQDLMSRLSTFAKPAAGGAVSFAVPESALTATLRQVPPSSDGKDAFDLAHAQIAATKAGLEVFLPFARNQDGSALRFTLRLTVEDGAPQADVSDAWIGNVRVPSPLVSALSEKLHEGLRQAAGAFKQAATLKSLQSEDGTLRVEAVFSPS